MLKIEAAKRGITMIELQDHLIRLGMIAEAEHQPREASPSGTDGFAGECSDE